MRLGTGMILLSERETAKYIFKVNICNPVTEQAIAGTLLSRALSCHKISCVGNMWKKSHGWTKEKYHHLCKIRTNHKCSALWVLEILYSQATNPLRYGAFHHLGSFFPPLLMYPPPKKPLFLIWQYSCGSWWTSYNAWISIFFCVPNRPLSLTMPSVRFIRTVACFCTVFIFLADRSFTVWVYHRGLLLLVLL